MRLRISMSLPLLIGLAFTTAPVASAATTEFPAGYEGYHTYAEVTAELNSVAARYGQGSNAIVKLFNIGNSFEGRPIWALKISDNVASDENEPEVLSECNMHAREHITAEMCLYMIRLLTNNYGKSGPVGQRVTQLVNTREIWIVPMLNPDGAEYDISDGAWHGWRKNRQTNPGSAKIGIDLNRNWSYKWNCCGGSSGNPASARYRGTHPFEAVEDQVLRDFILGRRVGGVQQITELLNWHSYGEHILWPYGYTKENVPPDMAQDDHSALVAMAQKMATLNGYHAMQGSAMYIYDGAFIDWAYGDQHIFPFTYEMYPGWGCGCGAFHPPDTVLFRETRRNRDAVLWFLEQADCVYREAGLAGAHC